MQPRFWGPFAASVAVYVIATAIAGRDVLQHLSTTTVHDAGDPLLTAAILHWTTTHVPLTDAWWQFPIFFPTRDVLAFSEHLLGISVIATPIEWLTRDVLTTYNLVTLATTPLCGASMYLLVWRLTRSHVAAFTAGVAFAFAPYRAAQLGHVQMLALFWAPLSLLGLHAFLDTGRRRWLALYGGGWLLQALANGYSLFFFSLVVALWVLWFVIARSHWRALALITATTALAAVPLVPVLYRYLVVHRAHAFSRPVAEMQFYSADAAAVLCAPPLLAFWSSVRVLCRPEGDLFPGLAIVVLACAGVVLLWRTRAVAAPATPRGMTLAWRVLVIVGLVFLAVAASVLLHGPWRIALGAVRASASEIRKPLLVAVPLLTVGLILRHRSTGAATGRPALAFYLVSALVMWLLALGPEVMVMGRDTHVPGLFNVLLFLPGMDGLRVPARFWMMTVLCLSIVVGLVVAEILESRRRSVALVVSAVAAAALLADGWVTRIPAADPALFPIPQAALAGRLVMQLPTGEVQTDVRASYEAAVGGSRSVTGYSGYAPNYQDAVITAMRDEDDALFEPFRAYDDLDIVVRPWDTRLVSLIERQPGMQFLGSGATARHYRLAHHGTPSIGQSAGRRVSIGSTAATCSAQQLALARDGDRQTGWNCYSEGVPQTLDVDLGTAADVGAVVMSLGNHPEAYARALEVTTSLDGVTWQPAWNGSLLAQAIRGGIADPTSLRLAVPFTPRQARYIRMHHPQAEAIYYWWIAELEVWSANTGIPDRSR